MADQAKTSVQLRGETRSAVLEAVRRYDPDFAAALNAENRSLTIPECLHVWDALMDELDVVFANGPEAESSPLLQDPQLTETVLDEMAVLKRAVLAGCKVVL